MSRAEIRAYILAALKRGGRVSIELLSKQLEKNPSTVAACLRSLREDKHGKHNVVCKRRNNVGPPLYHLDPGVYSVNFGSKGDNRRAIGFGPRTRLVLDVLRSGGKMTAEEIHQKVGGSLHGITSRCRDLRRLGYCIKSSPHRSIPYRYWVEE